MLLYIVHVPCPNSHAATTLDLRQLVADHIMFKDMAADEYLASAGIASDWPHGRGCYISNDCQFIIWVGEEDHLRIMSAAAAATRPAPLKNDASQTGCLPGGSRLTQPPAGAGACSRARCSMQCSTGCGRRWM